MVVVGSVYEKNKIIKDPDQEIYARRFERFAASLVRCFSEASCARKTSESATVQNGEHKFLVWILYIIISFFSYTRTAIQITTSVYVVRYWLRIFDFVNGRFVNF